MMTPELEILFPDKEVSLPNDQKIAVCELNHRKATQFLNMIAKYIPKIFDAQGDVSFTVEAMVQLASSTEELSNFLIQETTGIAPEKLPLSVSLEVLRTALEINLSEEIIEKGKKLADLFQDLATRSIGKNGGRSAAASARSTPSSSNTTTPARS